jgi:hypothetical protein
LVHGHEAHHLSPFRANYIQTIICLYTLIFHQFTFAFAREHWCFLSPSCFHIPWLDLHE